MAEIVRIETEFVKERDETDLTFIWSDGTQTNDFMGAAEFNALWDFAVKAGVRRAGGFTVRKKVSEVAPADFDGAYKDKIADEWADDSREKRREELESLKWRSENRQGPMPDHEVEKYRYATGRMLGLADVMGEPVHKPQRTFDRWQLLFNRSCRQRDYLREYSRRVRAMERRLRQLEQYVGSGE